MAYKLITILQKRQWTSYIKKSLIYDFCHTWYYHSLEKIADPFLFVYEHENHFIALPLLKRRIEGSLFFDCTSVYGHAGPFSDFRFEDLDVTILQDFKKTLFQFLQSKDIICLFSRLNPIINQQELWENLGGLYNHGRSVAIDLTVPIETQRSQYKRSLRMKINQLRKKGFVVREAESQTELKEFIRIYRENMERVNAAPYYFFSEQYFTDLLNSTEFESKLLLAFHNDEITAGVIVIFSNQIVQCHLAATQNRYLNESPMKLLFDEASEIGRRRNMAYFNLGGGVGGEEDALFKFKSCFSNFFLNFKTWRYVINEVAYNSLVRDNCNLCTLCANPSYFPLYRCELQFNPNNALMLSAAK